ncbi:MAG: hypothetical protein ACNYZG_12190 [Gammaproteobacteria bacterium]
MPYGYKELYDDIGTPAHDEDTERAITALQTIQASCAEKNRSR